MNKKGWPKTAIAALHALLAAYMAGKWAVRSAYLERGYAAVGGECLLPPMVAWAAYKVISIIFDILEGKGHGDGGCDETGGGGAAGAQDNG